MKLLPCVSLIWGLWSVADATGAEQPSVTRNAAETTIASIYECSRVSSARTPSMGRIVDSDGKSWTVPAEVGFRTDNKASDLYNECSGVVPKNFDETLAKSVPTIEVDADGDLITGYLLADNYFELFVNGKKVAVDPVPYTPFNSAVVRFRAKRPVTYAIKLVDWEEHLGLGTEKNGEKNFHPGDGGLVASFSDGTVTDSSWKAQTFYIAPLESPSSVIERGATHDTSALGTTLDHAQSPAPCAEHCYAIHYPIPADWAAPAFDDDAWPQATEFTPAQMGLDRLPAYLNVRDAFGTARAIWSANLVYDNLVLVRKVTK